MCCLQQVVLGGLWRFDELVLVHLAGQEELLLGGMCVVEGLGRPSEQERMEQHWDKSVAGSQESEEQVAPALLQSFAALGHAVEDVSDLDIQMSPDEIESRS